MDWKPTGASFATPSVPRKSRSPSARIEASRSSMRGIHHSAPVDTHDDRPLPPEWWSAAGDTVAPLGQLGEFRLLSEIGRGGMGVVYEAEQLSLQRRVALKVLPFASAIDPRQVQRFKNEALAAALLHHPNIVPIYAVGCERGVHFFAMQLIEGQSLAALVV